MKRNSHAAVMWILFLAMQSDFGTPVQCMSLSPKWLDRLNQDTLTMEEQTKKILQNIPKRGILGFQLRDDGLVCAFQPGSPAESKLLVNDLVLYVNDVPIEGMHISEASDLIRGLADTEVNLGIYRHGMGFISVSLKRQSVPFDLRSSDSATCFKEEIRPHQIDSIYEPGFSVDEDSMKILAVTSASESGVCVGDVLMNIDGIRASSISKGDMNRMLIGHPGSQVSLLLMREDNQGNHLVFAEVKRLHRRPTGSDTNSMNGFDGKALGSRHDSKQPSLSAIAQGVGSFFSGILSGRS